MGRKVTNTSPEAAARRKRQKRGYYEPKPEKNKSQTVPSESAPANSNEPSTQKKQNNQGRVAINSDASESNSDNSDKTIPTKITTMELPPGIGDVLGNLWFWQVLELRQASDGDFARLNSERTYDDAFLIGEAGVRSYGAVQMLIDRYPDLINLKKEHVPWVTEHLSEFRPKFRHEAEAGGGPSLREGTPHPPPGIRVVEKTAEQPNLRLVPSANGSEAKLTNGFHNGNVATSHVEESGTVAEGQSESRNGHTATAEVKGPPLKPVRHTFDVLSSLNATARDVKEELLWCREVMKRNAPRAVFTEMCCMMFLRGIEADPQQIESWRQEYVELFPDPEVKQKAHERYAALFGEDAPSAEPAPAEPLRPAWVAPVEDGSVPAGFDPDDPSTHPEEWGPLGWRGGVWRGGKRIEPSSLPPLPNERLCAFIVKMFGTTQNDAYLERTWTAEEEGLIDEVYSQAVGFVTDPDHAYALLLTWMYNYAVDLRREPKDGVGIGHAPAEMLRDLVKYAKPSSLDYPREQWVMAADIFESLEKFRARYVWGFEHGL
jgi:hypothetical protein